jgi:intracellular sulfur oxidation DsrE/DsrF family protein
MKTKQIFIVLISSLLLLAACNETQQPKEQTETAAEKAEEKKTDYLTLTNNVQQIHAIAHAVQIMQKNDLYNFGKMEVVVCGQTVTELTNSDVMEPIRKAIAESNLEVKACGFSVSGQKVDTTLLPPEIEVVDNGIAYAFEKQLEGYVVLGL